MTVERVAVAGGEIEAETGGSGPPVLLLHGWTFDRRIWTKQRADLERDHLVIAPDRRGFGRSSAPPSLAAEIDDILTLADRFAPDGFCLVGLSQGGRVALRFAAAHADRLTGLVLIGAPLDGLAPDPEAPEPNPIPVADYAALVRTGRVEEMRAAWLAHPFLQADDAHDRALLESIVGAYDGRDLAVDDPAAASWPAYDLADIATPTLVITGAHEAPARRHAARAIAAGLPHAVRREIADAGHVCNLTHAPAFNALLTEFLNSL